MDDTMIGLWREGHAGDRPGSGPDDAAGDRHGGETELAGDVDAGDHAVTGDVVRPGWTHPHDAQQERLTDVVFVDELHRHIGDQGGERNRSGSTATASRAATVFSGSGRNPLAPTAWGPTTGGRST
jgi:hypothetical protein